MKIADCRLQIENCRSLPFPDQPSVGARRGAGGEGTATVQKQGKPISGSHALTLTLSRRERGQFSICNLLSICNLQSAICGLLLFLAVVALPAGGMAQDLKRPKIVGVRVGIADRYKAGLWTQVDVTLLGGSEMLTGTLSVIVPDGDGVPGCVTKPCHVYPGRETVVRLITRFGRVDSDLKVVFRVGGDVVADRTFQAAIHPDAEHFAEALEFQKLIVSVGVSPLDVEGEGKPGHLDAESRPVIARVDDVERLPTHWCGYEGVDAVILLASRSEIYNKLTVNNNVRVQALDQWVRMGGRLVLCVGSRGGEVLAESSSLRQFAPGRFKKVVLSDQTGAIETYCGSHVSIGQAVGSKPMMEVSQLADVQGVIEVGDPKTPLVIRTARGFGQVIFVAADLDQSPLNRWSDRPLLVARLLDMPTGSAGNSSENAAMMHYGYNDMAGQMRSALDRFTGVQLVPFWLVASLIVGYILLIGPADYFFLRKVVGRMEWTWVTFPLVVALVCVAAYCLAYRLKGDQLRVNQIDLVDVDAASGRMRGATWLNVFSPRMESFNFTVEPRGLDGQAVPDARVWMGWLGLPGSGLGGMNPHANGPLLWNDGFRYATDLDALEGVPIQVWSTKSLTARWEAPSAAYPAVELTEADQILSGAITNTLSFPLRDCILAHRGSLYELGTLAPGQSVRLGPTVRRSELKTFLTRTVFSEGANFSQQGTPYSQSSTELAYILQKMMFYEAAGGRHYTHLSNSYQEFVDLSNLLKTGRAILVAQTPVPAAEGHEGAELLGDGKPLAGRQDQHGTIYRFIFPVKGGQSAAKQ